MVLILSEIGKEVFGAAYAPAQIFTTRRIHNPGLRGLQGFASDIPRV